jgi:hypothetical protein
MPDDDPTAVDVAQERSTLHDSGVASKQVELRLRGWALWRDIDDTAKAVELAAHIASAFVRRFDAPIADLRAAEMLELGATPTRASAADAPYFRALGFAGGHPVVESGNGQRFAALVGWYADGERERCKLETRLVSIPALLPAAAPIDAAQVEGRLGDYVVAYGNRWPDVPDQRPLRLACLARFLDALQPAPTLVARTARDWFVEAGDSAEQSLAREVAYFEQCGVDLAQHEVRVLLEPGDLLVVDNLTCAHGFVGPLPQYPRIECTFGTSGLTAGGVRAIRAWWAARLGERWSDRRAQPVA